MSRLAWIYLLLLSFIWGASFAFIEVALRHVPPVSLVFVRVLLGGVALWLWLIWRGVSLPKTMRFWAPITLMGLINNVIPFILIAWGQQSISAGTASIINANTAFAGVLVSALFLADEMLKLHRLLGVLIGISGVVLVIGPQNLVHINPASLGQLAVLGATISYAFAGVWGRLRLSGFESSQLACGMLLTASWQMVLLMMLIDGLPSPAQIFNLEMAYAMMGLGVAGTAFAYLLYFQILRLAGASNVLLVTIIVPVFAVFLDAVLLGQWVGWPALAGFLVVAAGLAVMDGRLWSLTQTAK